MDSTNLITKNADPCKEIAKTKRTKGVLIHDSFFHTSYVGICEVPGYGEARQSLISIALFVRFLTFSFSKDNAYYEFLPVRWML